MSGLTNRLDGRYQTAGITLNTKLDGRYQTTGLTANSTEHCDSREKKSRLSQNKKKNYDA